MIRNSNMNNVLVRRIVYGTLLLMMMSAIFFFSSMPGEDSGGLSERITEAVIHFVFPDYSNLSAEQQIGAFTLLHHLIRKLAHFSEYAVLGALFMLFFNTFSLKHKVLVSLLCAVLYAVSDEWHQGFVAARGPAVSDVILDSAGAAFGLVIALLCIHFRKSRFKDRL